MSPARPRRRRSTLWDRRLEEIKDLLSRLGVRYREAAKLRGRGGICEVEGEWQAILPRHLNTEEKVDVLLRDLPLLDLEGVFVAPEIRELLEVNAGAATEDR